MIRRRTYARIGLLGNPSDSFFGKTISFSLANFYAEVTLIPSAALGFAPHPEHDGGSYASMGDLHQRLLGEGYSGGIRLLKAACAVFWRTCQELDLDGKLSRNFTLSYDTNIPRQAGLSGSSAIVCAAMNCLLDFYGLQEMIPVLERPRLVLAAEEELGITAGLQDRVVQVYGGVVYMDFDRSLMERSGGIGRYESLDPERVPRLWLVYARNPSDSGAVHSDVRRRWREGDAEVAAAMAEFGNIARRGRDYKGLAKLMDENFDLRRKVFGDAVLGSVNLRMVSCARSVGAAAKFTGSGGAIVAFCPEGEAQEQRLRAACEAAGFTVQLVQIGPQKHFARVSDIDEYLALEQQQP